MCLLHLLAQSHRYRLHSLWLRELRHFGTMLAGRTAKQHRKIKQLLQLRDFRSDRAGAAELIQDRFCERFRGIP